jgi:hypothetical protein
MGLVELGKMGSERSNPKKEQRWTDRIRKGLISVRPNTKVETQ